MAADAATLSRGAELNLADYLAVFARRKWAMLAICSAVVGAAVGYTLLQDAEYQATASVLVRTSDTVGLFPLDGAVEVTRSVAGEQAFLNSDEFRSQAESASPQPSAVRTISDEADEDPSRRSVIDFEARAASGADAAAAANAWAQTYIDQRFENETAEVTSSIAAVQRSLTGLETRRSELTAPIADVDQAIEESNDPVQIARLNGERLLLVEQISTELDAIDSQISRLNENVAGMQVKLDLLDAPELSARVSQPAAPPSSPYSPNIPRNIALGIVLGVISALAVALILESLDGRLRSTDELDAVTGLPHLASIPRLQKRGATLGLNEAHQRVVSALTLSRMADHDETSQVILMTSAHASEGKTSTATAVARLLAKGQSRTLVIDADLHRPNVAQQLGVANRIGFADYLSGSRSIDEVIFPVPGTSYLDVIPSGRAEPASALDLLRSPRFEALVLKARGAYDRIIIDSPPVLAVVDAVEVAVHCDSCVLVVRSGRLRANELLEAQRSIEASGVAIAGTVLIAPLLGGQQRLCLWLSLAGQSDSPSSHTSHDALPTRRFSLRSTARWTCQSDSTAAGHNFGTPLRTARTSAATRRH